MKHIVKFLAASVALLTLAVFVSAYDAPGIGQAQVTRRVDEYTQVSYTTTIDASTTIATAIGAALPDECSGVTIINQSTSVPMYVQFDGTAADATAGYIAAGGSWPIVGPNSYLANVRLYAASTITISVFVHAYVID